MDRIVFLNLAPEYPVMAERYCSDDGREDRQSVMMSSCAVWAVEEGFSVDVLWDLESEPRGANLRAVFLVLFSVAGYRLKNTIAAYKACADCQIIVCGPHAVSFPGHCYAAGADAVVGRCDHELLRQILTDVRTGAVKRYYHTPRPILSLPHQKIFRELGFLPKQDFMNVLGSTGCPYTCEFCTDAENDYAPLRIEDTLENVRTSDEPLVIFNDPTFGVGRAGRALITGLATIPDRHFVAFITNALVRDFGFRSQLVSSRFVLIEIGLENINTKFSKNRAADVIELFAQCDFLILVNYIWGYDERDLSDTTIQFLTEMSRRCPNVFPMVFVPFSLPETPLHSRHLEERRIFDPSYLCIGNDILSMRIPGARSPRDYYERIVGLNDTLYDGHAERMHDWIVGNPRLDQARKQVMLQLLGRHVREQVLVDRWWGCLRETAPEREEPFARQILRQFVPDFDRYDLVLDAPVVTRPASSQLIALRTERNE